MRHWPHSCVALEFAKSVAVDGIRWCFRRNITSFRLHCQKQRATIQESYCLPIVHWPKWIKPIALERCIYTPASVTLIEKNDEYFNPRAVRYWPQKHCRCIASHPRSCRGGIHIALRRRSCPEVDALCSVLGQPNEGRDDCMIFALFYLIITWYSLIFTWWVLDGYLMGTWSRDSMIENIGLGIFNWALEGLRDYLKVGPEDSWGSHQGNGWIPTGERQHRILIAECCELGRFKTCKNAALYGQYLNFYVMLGLGPLSQKPKIHTTRETLRIWCTTYTKSSKG